ncbi:MAG: hypothetical protein HWD84_06870 [Flavobacteriaceae bacterium]|jgi:hypothetical protein|nr:hypothetical protein [Flavobacteriaceae bacterium]
MKLIKVKRTTRYEKRYSKKMGELTTTVTYIKRYILGIPTKVLHKYRMTYYGEIKDCDQCNLMA